MGFRGIADTIRYRMRFERLLGMRVGIGENWRFTPMRGALMQLA
jgi:hypothetical protein